MKYKAFTKFLSLSYFSSFIIKGCLTDLSIILYKCNLLSFDFFLSYQKHNFWDKMYVFYFVKFLNFCMCFLFHSAQKQSLRWWWQKLKIGLWSVRKNWKVSFWNTKTIIGWRFMVAFSTLFSISQTKLFYWFSVSHL